MAQAAVTALAEIHHRVNGVRVVTESGSEVVIDYDEAVRLRSANAVRIDSVIEDEPVPSDPPKSLTKKEKAAAEAAAAEAAAAEAAAEAAAAEAAAAEAEPDTQLDLLGG